VNLALLLGPSGKPQKTNCLNCGYSYWYDGCSWCPACEVGTVERMLAADPASVLPNAPERIALLRKTRQDELQTISERHC
jgi:hypothetical protein